VDTNIVNHGAVINLPLPPSGHDVVTWLGRLLLGSDHAGVGILAWTLSWLLFVVALRALLSTVSSVGRSLWREPRAKLARELAVWSAVSLLVLYVAIWVAFVGLLLWSLLAEFNRILLIVALAWVYIGTAKLAWKLVDDPNGFEDLFKNGFIVGNVIVVGSALFLLAIAYQLWSDRGNPSARIAGGVFLTTGSGFWLVPLATLAIARLGRGSLLKRTTQDDPGA
jgi:hypothetical protein